MSNLRFGGTPNSLVAYLSGEIDHHSAQKLRLEIDAQLQIALPETLTLDFEGVTFMDSSGIGLILGRARRMEALEGRLVVQHPPLQIQKMLKLAHLTYL